MREKGERNGEKLCEKMSNTSVTAQYSNVGLPPMSGMTTIARVMVLFPFSRLEPVVIYGMPHPPVTLSSVSICKRENGAGVRVAHYNKIVSIVRMLSST